MCRAEAILGGFFHRLQNDLHESLRKLRLDLRRIARCIVDLHHRNGDRAGRNERKAARYTFIKHYADRIKVGIEIGRFSACLLGRDIVDRSDRLVGHRKRCAGRKLCDTEVCDLDLAVFEKYYILGLDIAVDNALAVCVLECQKDLADIVARLFPL